MRDHTLIKGDITGLRIMIDGAALVKGGSRTGFHQGLPMDHQLETSKEVLHV